MITDPSTSGTVAHESFGHGVELDMFVKDRTGKQVGKAYRYPDEPEILAYKVSKLRNNFV